MSRVKSLVLLLASLACSAALAQSGPPIKVGAFVARTGQAAFLGEPARKTLELYVDQVNKAGGVNGRKLDLVLYDSKSSAKDAAELVRRLIEQDKVDILVGGVTTGETMAVVPMVEEAKLTFVSLAGATVVIDPVKRFVFKTPHTDKMSVEQIYRRVRQDGGSKVALLSGAGGYDQSCRKHARDLAGASTVQLVADEQHGTGDTDVTVQLTNIRRTNPDAILYCGFGAPSAIVAKNHRQLGLQPRLYMTVGVASKAYIDAAEGAAEGSRVTGAAIIAYADIPPNDPVYPPTRRFHESYRAAYNEEPSSFAGNAHDGIMLAVEALKAAGGTDREKVRAALENLKGVAGVNGVYTMSATDHLGIRSDSLRIVEVRGNQFRLLKSAP
jgi:branched-chain amino acid transport system substrate-binding protein